MEGGASGKVVEPGDPQDSLIVKRLRGLGGDRMPKDKPPVSSEAIARFEVGSPMPREIRRLGS